MAAGLPVVANADGGTTESLTRTPGISALSSSSAAEYTPTLLKTLTSGKLGIL
jgi:hypothetical protein